MVDCGRCYENSESGSNSGATKVNNHAGGGVETKVDGVGWSTGQCSKSILDFLFPQPVPNSLPSEPLSNRKKVPSL